MFECSSENTIWPDTVLVETVQLCWGDLVAQNMILVGYSVWICLVLSWQNILVIIPRIHWFNVNLKFTLNSLIFFFKGGSCLCSAVVASGHLWKSGCWLSRDEGGSESFGASNQSSAKLGLGCWVCTGADPPCCVRNYSALILKEEWGVFLHCPYLESHKVMEFVWFISGGEASAGYSLFCLL